jgi:hypothetical protein
VGSRADKITELATLILLTLGGVLADAGWHTSPSKAWFFASWLSFGLAVLVPTAYFGIHPLFIALARWRTTFLSRESTMVTNRRVRRWGAPWRGRQHEQVKTSQLEILSAEYSADDGKGSPVAWNVVDTVRAAVSGTTMTIPVTNAQFGGDPFMNIPKALRVRYRLHGVEGVKTFNEGEVAVIP